MSQACSKQKMERSGQIIEFLFAAQRESEQSRWLFITSVQNAESF